MYQNRALKNGGWMAQLAACRTHTWKTKVSFPGGLRQGSDTTV